MGVKGATDQSADKSAHSKVLLLAPLYLVPKHAFDHLRISFVPAVEIVHREGILDGCEFLIFLIQHLAGAGAEMESDKRALHLFGPQILHEGVHHGPIGDRDITVNDYSGMFAEDRRFR